MVSVSLIDHKHMGKDWDAYMERWDAAEDFYLESERKKQERLAAEAAAKAEKKKQKA